jgi:predicted GIY-YIG superfamily endonuclease
MAALRPQCRDDIVLKQPAIYSLPPERDGLVRTCIPSNLARRASPRRAGAAKGVTQRHDRKLRVWFEAGDMMEAAITRENQFGGGSRMAETAPRHRRVIAGIAKPSHGSCAAPDCAAMLAPAGRGSP